MSRPRTRRPRWAFEQLDVRVLRRRGEIEDGQEVLGSLALEWRPCPFGGARPFWRCPRCDRLCQVLFLPDPARSGPVVVDGHACRVCQRVAYETTGMARLDRLFARRDAILDALSLHAPAPRWNDPGLKPRGMHYRTFERLLDKARRLELAALQAGLASLGRRLDG